MADFDVKPSILKSKVQMIQDHTTARYIEAVNAVTTKLQIGEITKINKKSSINRMRKISRTVAAILLTAVMAGCQNAAVKQEQNEESGKQDMPEYTAWFEGEQTVVGLEYDLEKIIAENPIDQTMTCEKEDASSRIKFACQYRDAWKNEIEHTLTVLKDSLVDEDYQTLCKSYKEWQQYIDDIADVEKEIFYPAMRYGIGGSLTYPEVMEAQAGRTKEYAVQLMSLEYALTGKVDFAYHWNKE